MFRKTPNELGTYSAIGKWIERQGLMYENLATPILLSDLETKVYPHEIGSSAFPLSMKFIITCCYNRFAGRQLTPPPNLAPLRADNGAVVVWDKPTNEVDAEQNYWDHRDGPFAFGNNNKEGSYASIYVNYRKWLKRAP